MESGIYAGGELCNEISVVFGGKIIVGSGVIESERQVAVGFQELSDEHEVGTIPDEEFSDNKPTVFLRFDNEKSIDVVISHLEHVKNLLNGL